MLTYWKQLVYDAISQTGPTSAELDATRAMSTKKDAATARKLGNYCIVLVNPVENSRVLV